MKKKLKDIAQIINGTLIGDPNIDISGVTGIEEAGPMDITFAVPPHLDKALISQAAAVIIPDTITEFAKPAIRVVNPRVAFTQLLELFTPPLPVERGIHPTAIISPDAVIGDDVAIMPYVVIEPGAVVGDGVVIYPHVYIGHGVHIGNQSVLYPNVTIRENCQLGKRVIVHSSTVVGADGFGFVTHGGQHLKVPQVGNVIIEDDVEIGANVAIDRATTSSTMVKRGTKIDNLVHVAHNVVIGENCFLVAQTGIAGSTKVGNQVTFAGQTGCIGHLTIGDNCVFGARAGIIGNVPSNVFYAGFPARPHKEWLRGEAGIQKIPELIKKVRDLEKRLAELEQS